MGVTRFATIREQQSCFCLKRCALWRVQEEICMEPTIAFRPYQRVMLVDDVPAIRRVVQEILALLAYPVLATADIHRAVHLWAADSASLLVADGTLLNSHSASLRQLLEPHASRLVVMSGYALRDLPGLAPMTGMAFLHKPFTIDELHAVMGRMAPSAGCAVGAL
jgi:DNA-binding NtrC family response regulator